MLGEQDFRDSWNDCSFKASCTRQRYNKFFYHLLPSLLFTLLFYSKLLFFSQFSSRNVSRHQTQSRAQKSQTAYYLSCIRPDPCPGLGAPSHRVPVDLMEFMSEYVFAFALSGSGPRKGSHRLWNPKRRPSRTFCAPAEVRDHTGKRKVKAQPGLCGNGHVRDCIEFKEALVILFQDSTSSKVFA